MKKLLSTLLFSVLMAAALQAGTGAAMKFKSLEYNFGEVEKGKSVHYEFEFTNDGDEELVITEVKPSCGCTTAEMTKKNFAPKEAGKIPITFDSTRFAGNIEKTISVVSNDATNPRVQLKLKGKIIQEVSMSPTYLTLVNIKRNETVERTIEVNTEKLPKLEVTELSSDISFLKLKAVRKDDKNITIQVSFNGKDIPADKPTSTGFISFKHNGKTEPDVKINVYIKVASPVQTTPRAIYMFASPKGKERDQVVSLKSDVPYKITEISSDLDYVQVSKTGDDSLKVVLTTKAPEGKFSGTITVKTNLEEQPEIKVPIRGNVI